MNKILNKILEERNGHYCHVLEVTDKWELESIVESFIESYTGYTEQEYIRFFESMDVYALDDTREDEVYSFSFSDYITNTL